MVLHGRLACLALAFALAGCGGGSDDGSPGTAPGAPGAPVKPLEPVDHGPPPSAPADGVIVLPPEALLGPVLAHAAENTAMDQEALEIVASRPVTWSDGSLGCPQPGMSYTQALVPGWHVLVRAGEQVLDYRLSGRGGFLLCLNPSPGGLAPGPEPRVER